MTFSRVARENRARNCPFHYTTLTQAPQALSNDLPSTSASILSSENRLRPFVGMDGFGIVYLIENAQEFWSGALCGTLFYAALADAQTELEDIVKIPGNASLSLLDATLKRSLTFCASYHGALWQTPAHFHVLTLGTCRTLFTKSFTT
jgi:hypothetical protein